MNKITIIITILVAVVATKGLTQTNWSENDRQMLVQDVLDSLKNVEEASKPFRISGYIETYYSYDFANPLNHVRQPFMYSFNRHNEVNLNLGLVQMAYDTDKVRANLGLMAGAYSNDNLAAEPGVMKNVFEANAGVKLSDNQHVWLDAGIFPSHIGFESAIGMNCWNLTRSLLAENSPYYEAGVKVSYTSNDGEWFVSGLLLNGWQRMYRPDGNNTPAFGHQLTWTPNDKVIINSSSFIGSDTPDENRQMRYFHNLYGQFQVQEKLGLIVGFDIGTQQVSKGSDDYNTWYSPVVIARYSPTEKVNIGLRAEYYQDEAGVIIASGTPNGFQTWGYSINLDYNITDKVMWRAEGRTFNSEDPIFVLDNEPSTNNFFLTTSLAIVF